MLVGELRLDLIRAELRMALAQRDDPSRDRRRRAVGTAPGRVAALVKTARIATDATLLLLIERRSRNVVTGAKLRNREHTRLELTERRDDLPRHFP